MAFFSIFKIGLWVIGGIFGLFVVKKITTKKKVAAPPKKVEIVKSEDENENDNSNQLQRSHTKEKAVEMVTEYEEEVYSRSTNDDKSTRKELKALMIKVSELIDRGFDNTQIARSVASNSAREVPKSELAPMVDALRRFLSGYDEKSVKAQEKYNLKAQNDYKAIAELRKGNPEIAIDFLERRLNQLEASADSIADEHRRMTTLAQASELARHLAVLSAAVDSRSSYEFAKQSVELNGLDVKSLDLLGYYELGFEQLDEAEQYFNRALALDNSKEDKVWVELAREGLETIKSKKPTDVHLKGPEKNKNTVRMTDIASALDRNHVRDE